MMFSEVVRLAVDSFRASKTRFMLTMLGMVIGSASIILVATLGSPANNMRWINSPASAPTRSRCSMAAAPSSGPDNTSTPDYMTLDDMNAVLDQVPGIVASSPMLEFHDNVSLGGGVTQPTMLLGVSPQYRIVRNLVVVAGRFFDDQDALAHEKVAVIVKPFAEELYGSVKPPSAKPSASKAYPLSSSASSTRASTPTGSRRSATRPCSFLIRSPATSPAPTR